MATYTVIGHPLNYSDLGLSNTETVRALLIGAGVGSTITIVLSGPDDTKMKAHACLK